MHNATLTETAWLLAATAGAVQSAWLLGQVIKGYRVLVSHNVNGGLIIRAKARIRDEAARLSILVLNIVGSAMLMDSPGFAVANLVTPVHLPIVSAFLILTNTDVGVYIGLFVSLLTAVWSQRSALSRRRMAEYDKAH